MANILWPQSLCPRTFSLQLVSDVRIYPATFGGSENIAEMSSDFWTVAMEIDSRSSAVAAQLEALVNYLQGGIHTVEFGHFARPAPGGSISLTSTVSLSAAKGASSITISALTGATVKAGDLFSADGLLLMCSEDAVASSGAVEIPIVNRLRRAINAGASVNFDNPKLKFRVNSESGVNNLVGYSAPVGLSFVEDI